MAFHYAACKDLKRKPVQIIANIESITSNYRVLPLYEKTVRDDSLRKNYSLLSNELLKCRWLEYNDSITSRAMEGYTPFRLPDVRDEHFYNQNIRWIPSQSVRHRTDFRLKLSPGPGVDFFGSDKLIPNELNVYRNLKTGLRNDLEKLKNQKEEELKKARNAKEKHMVTSMSPELGAAALLWRLPWQ